MAKYKITLFCILFYTASFISKAVAQVHQNKKDESVEAIEPRTPEPKVSESAAQLHLVQYNNPENPEKLVEYGVLEVNFKSSIPKGKRIKSIKIEVPSGEKSSGLFGKSKEIVVENPNLANSVKFKMDSIQASILWGLHEKKHTLPIKILYEGDSDYILVPQENDIKIEKTKIYGIEAIKNGF